MTYRVIQVSDGQLEAQTDGAAAVSLVAGFPATSQTVTQVRATPLTWRSKHLQTDIFYNQNTEVKKNVLIYTEKKTAVCKPAAKRLGDVSQSFFDSKT